MRKVEEEVVTKSQVGSGRGLHDRAGDEGVRLAWSPVITFCPISSLPLLDLSSPSPIIHPLTYRHPIARFSLMPTSSRPVDSSGQHLSTLLPCNYWPSNEEGCADATFENLLLEITAPERAYVSRASWQIGICADSRNELAANLGFRHECNLLMLLWENMFIGKNCVCLVSLGNQNLRVKLLKLNNKSLYKNLYGISSFVSPNRNMSRIIDTLK